MAKGKSGFLSDSAYNQSGNKEDSPDQKTPYYTWDDVMAHHGSEEGADMTSSVNSESGEGIHGHGAPQEPHGGPVASPGMGGFGSKK